MRIMQIKTAARRLCAFLLCLSMVNLCGCAFEGTATASEGYRVYDDYRDIPGITQAEIEKIEALKQSKTSLVYGMCPSTETFYDEQGNIGGYTALFCDWLTDLFGIEIHPVIVEWDDLQSRMQDGTIDFTGEMTANPERRKVYHMTSAIAERSIKMFRLQDAEKLSEITEERTLIFAFLEDANTASLVEAVAEYDFEKCFVSNYDEVDAKLKNKEIDAFLIDGPAEEAFNSYENIVAETFFPLIYTPVSLATLNAELDPLISVLQKYLDDGAIIQLIRLYNKGHHEYLQHKLFMKLTAEEKAYIADHIENDIPIPIAMETDVYPIIFYNEQEGEWQGIANDVLNEITDLSGLRFAVVNKPSDVWHILLDMLESGEAAMTTELIYSKEREGRFLWADNPYTEDRFALLSTVEHEDVNINQVLYSKVGIVYESAYADIFHAWFPEHPNVAVFMNMDDAFAALERGEIDLLMTAKNLLLRITNYMEKPGFKANFVFERVYGSSFGFNKEEVILRSIISKAQNLVDTDVITSRWTSKVFDYRAKMTRSQIPILIGLALVIAVAFGLALALAIRRHRANMVLESTVRERTAELQVQRDAANGVAKATGDFLARMSHEIRTPLNAIVGMARVARQNAGDREKTVHSVDEVLGASRHLMDLINDILDFSKIESGKLELVVSAFDLPTAIQEIASLINPRCIDQGISFEINPKTLPQTAIIGDKLRLKQVLINLLGNSVKFTAKGGRTQLLVETLEQSEDSIMLRFSVSDSGIGIPKERQAKLFSAFEQTDSSIAITYGGTGLGLAISQSIVQAMGGVITVESALGEGSTFSFTVNFPTAVLPESTAEQSTPVETLDLTGKHILMAEDIDINRLILVELLADTGLEIDEAVDGEQALAMFEQSEPYHYELIFMDVQMPNMDGYQATEAIRGLDRPDAKGISIIAMTANAYREDIDRALVAGMNGHVAKPIDIDEIRQLLHDKLADPSGE